MSGPRPSPSCRKLRGVEGSFAPLDLAHQRTIICKWVKVIEIIPPAVKAEFHGESESAVGMDLDVFIDEVWGDPLAGKITIAIGMLAKTYDEERREGMCLDMLNMRRQPTYERCSNGKLRYSFVDFASALHVNRLIPCLFLGLQWATTFRSR